MIPASITVAQSVHNGHRQLTTMVTLRSFRALARAILEFAGTSVSQSARLLSYCTDVVS